MAAGLFPAPHPIPGRFLKHLPRGGVLVHAPRSQHTIQFGIPPGTVKDSMLAPAPWRPQLYALDATLMFDDRSGRTAEPEFPMYHGFFIASDCKAPTHFAIPPALRSPLDTVLRTSYLGPQWPTFSRLELAREYPGGAATVGFPDMPAELRHWAKIPIDQMRVLHSIPADGLFFEGVQLFALDNGRFRLFDAGHYLGDLDAVLYRDAAEKLPHVPVSDNAASLAALRDALDGRAMIVPIHSSDGFDPTGETSGHMLWNRGHVVLVDPPADTRAFLRQHGIADWRVRGVLLTHVHGDHDSGTLPALLAGGRKTLWTTASIHRMWLDKLAALTAGRYPREGIAGWWDFQPVPLLTPITINGLQLVLRHGFHSNIAFGYSVVGRDGAPRFSFSGDTFNDAAVFQLVTQGVIAGPARAADIVHAPIAAALAGGVSAHECGTPPLHTQTPQLQEASAAAAAVGGRVVAYHASRAKLAAAGLTPWGDGFVGAVALSDESASESPPAQLSTIPLFADLPADQLDHVHRRATRLHVAAGQQLTRQGAHGSTLYLLVHGTVDVTRRGRRGSVRLATLHGGLIGEGALLGETRNATVTARGPVEVLRWTVTRTLARELAAIGLVDRIRRLRTHRQHAIPGLRRAPLLAGLDQAVFDELLLNGTLTRVASGDTVIRRGETDDTVYLLLRGGLEVVSNGDTDAPAPAIPLRPGAVVGEMALLSRGPRTKTVRAGRRGATLLQVPGPAMRDLLYAHPALELRLQALAHKRESANATRTGT
ncbi:MAG: cyclic nucleotide-binding domain-containing protein [Deltaproteobacteria bacterium]|nr:cyclic nucleotide-binding domain-containing protein [Deltaproteobacteria bacterium]